MKSLSKFLWVIFGWVGGALTVVAAPGTTGHPCLLLTPSEVVSIRANLGQAPLFDKALAGAKARMELALVAPQVVPVPADAAGFTHERHKQNYAEMQQAGFLYQITGDVRYAEFVKTMLQKYAVLYPTLGKHPAATGSGYGRLFWQSLNETVWLVNVTQAYDCIYDTLTAAERALFEGNIFKPMADFFSVEHARTVNRIHNHGVWMATAVGMAGYVMGDQNLVKKALYGTKMDGVGGYFQQLEGLYAPNGYYAEGPYYARYVIMPFYVFAQVIEHNQPELKVFGRRDGVLGKALYTLLQQTNFDGRFIPINDALKEKTYESQEVVLAVDLAYARYDRDPQLLSIAKGQNQVALNQAGMEVARALAQNANPPSFEYKSMELRDGPQGDTGGLGILRQKSGASESMALLKYTTLGMDHGHFDKLNFIYFDQGNEIISDYGAVRFLNIEQKFGGRYLPENNSFAKQTIAHNTVSVDQQSHYKGSYETAEPLHSDKHFFEIADADFQVVSARDTTAVPGVAMQRTVAMVRDARLAYPVVIDVMRVVSAQAHHYDLPFYYQGQFLKTNVAFKYFTEERRPLGKKNGYQHLWLEAVGEAKGNIQFTWLNGHRFYSLCSAASPGSTVSMVRIGANDPNNNLRSEPAFILQTKAASTVFATVIEPHGNWDGTTEVTSGGFPTVQDVQVVSATEEGTVVKVTGAGGLAWTLCISNRPAADGGAHRVEVNGEVFAWNGNAALRRN